MATAIRSNLQVYNAAKSNGDVAEASKSFATVFDELFLQDDKSLEQQSITLFLVTNQMKDEIRLLVNELKSQFLKINPISMPTTLPVRSLPSIHQHPAANGWKKVCQESRFNSSNQTCKADENLSQSTEAFFYQQLFENLPEAIKKRILDQSIDACDNSLDRCRLMMLAMTIFSDTAPQYGSELLKTLIDLSEPLDDVASPETNGKPRPPDQLRVVKTSKHAKNSLILDAIPLVLKTASIADLDTKADSLIERTLNFYSNHCLEIAATEYEYHELHEGLKKDIVCRILGNSRTSASDDAIEERLNKTLALLNEKYIETISEERSKSRLKSLKAYLIYKPISNVKFHEVLHLICDLKLEIDIPNDILFKTGDDETPHVAIQSAPTPPPKGRGRPRKVRQTTVIVSPDDTSRKIMQAKAHETKVVFFLLVQYLFRRCAMYLRQTKTRILTNLANPIATTIETELSKGASQRTSRSKASSQQSTVKTVNTTPKGRKLPEKPIDGIESIVYPEDSPLNSKESKKLDSMMMNSLIEAQRCMRFLNSNHGSITKLWHKFSQDHILGKLKWYYRMMIDCAIIAKDYDLAIETITALKDLDELETPTLIRKDIPAPGSSTLKMRLLLQTVCCQLQKNDMMTFEAIHDLLIHLNTSKLLTQDESYKCGNIIDEHMVAILSESDEFEDIGFIFFDLLSIMRYVVSLLMEYLKRVIASSQGCNDLAIGHTIVLSQFDWPRESESYDKCISWIRINKPQSTTPQCLSTDTKFTYPDFTRFIKNPCMIEDFMALLNLCYTLDIKVDEEANKLALVEVPGTRGSNGSQERQAGSGGRGATGGSRSGKAITTRGVNKTFREDLKVALIAQMRSSTTLVPLNMITDFCIELIENFFSPRFVD